ncbi:MAG TPA: hypothetical protein PKJ19_16495, partial [Flavobacteriales bacterium]|nr:hypothetical protein [Flavobacteriales bacterium]
MRIILVISVLLPFSCSAQYWRSIGQGVMTFGGIQLIHGDTELDRLLGAGPWPEIYNDMDTIRAMGIAVWNGERWDSLGYRISDGEAQTHCFLRHAGELYASGNWLYLNDQGIVNTGIARFDENTLRWEDLGCTNPQFSGLATITSIANGTGFYFTGHRGDPCSLPASNVFAYDGSNYESWIPFEQIPYAQDNYVGFVFEFLSMTYMTGLFRDPLSDGYSSMMRYNGPSPERTPSCFHFNASCLSNHP